MDLKRPVTELKGIGPKKASLLAKLGISTLEDLMLYFPRDYQDRRHICPINEITEEKPVLIQGTVKTVKADPYRPGRRQILRVFVVDRTGGVEILFFNARYLVQQFLIGKSFDFYGRASWNKGKLQMVHPDYSPSQKDTMRGILPIYPMTAGLGQKEMRTWQKTLLSELEEIEDYLPEEIIERNNLCSLNYAISNVHFPTDKTPLLQGKYRLIFDELMALQVGLLTARHHAFDSREGLIFDNTAETEYIEGLSYSLTGAQQRVVKELSEDMRSGKVMNRLVQGDVGSGKTVIAEIALYKAVKSGYQGVMMAPTEILAKQHFESLSRGFEPYGVTVGLLTGSQRASQKKEVLQQLESGQIQILVGTHAIIQPGVQFRNLGLVITDEQHRFGVKQRTALSEKGNNPHTLVMTATPIPRTLAVILYGDLDVSIIDELPPGRQKIITRAVKEAQRDIQYDFVEKQLQEGRQAYIVAPLIEESEVLDVKSAEELYEEMQQRFSGYSVALLHGAMKQKEKDEIMERFYENRIQVLVSTVVIEVGINVPNATMMVIENAERFGLAQLHQLRGRVGRGSWQSYCILVSNGKSEIAQKRAKLMEESQDGFYIAEQDLKLRGPGEIFGTRQHGVPDLSLADLAKHMKILYEVKREADIIMEEDPMLETEKYQGLRNRVKKLFGEDFSFKL